MIHGTEPYTGIIATPFAIRDPGLEPGVRADLASTVDIAPTCLALLGIDADLPFKHSGVDLARAGRDFAYAQNFTANQPDRVEAGIAKAFSISDRTYTLLAI
jgi:arylsulfatase A-like enzyme